MELCKKYPVFCTIWAFIEVVLFAGVIFGWGSLVFILKDEGFYIDSCMDSTIEIDSGFILLEHREPISSNTVNTTVNAPKHDIISTIESNSSVHSHIDEYDILNANDSKRIVPERNEIKGCQAQESKLNLWFSIAVSFMYLSFGGIGYIIRHFGTRVTRIGFFIIYLIGTLCLAFASPDVWIKWTLILLKCVFDLLVPVPFKMSMVVNTVVSLVPVNLRRCFAVVDNPWLLLPGLCCIGTGGLVVLGTNMQVSYLHPRLRSTIVAIFTGLFDFSSINKQLVRIMYDHGVARRISYIVISVVFAILIMISTLLFLPKMNINEEFVKETDKKKRKSDESEEEEREMMDTAGVTVEPVMVQQGAEADVNHNPQGEELAKLGVSNNISINTTDRQKPSLCSTILSVTFIFHLLWLFVHALRFVTFIGQLNVWLSNIFDKDEVKVGQMLGIFSYMTMGAIGTALFCGFVYDYIRKRYTGSSEIRRIYLPVVLPMVLVVFYSAGTTVCCYIQHEIAAYLAFAFFTFFRSSLFTVAVAFVGDAFPAEYFGVLFGMIQVSAGTAGLMQYPLFTWYDNAYEGSYMHVNILLLVLQVLTLIHPLLLFIKGKRDTHDKSSNTFRQEYTISVPSTA